MSLDEVGTYGFFFFSIVALRSILYRLGSFNVVLAIFFSTERLGSTYGFFGMGALDLVKHGFSIFLIAFLLFLS